MDREDHRADAYAFTLVRRHLVDPDGGSFDRDVVKHMGAVAVIPVDDDLRVHLVRQFRAPLLEAIVETPAGLCDHAGEERIVTAHRELAEEVGLVATSMVHLVDCWNSPGYSTQVTSIFLATGLSPVEVAPDGVEERFFEQLVVPLEDLLDPTHGTVDAITMLAALLAHRHLRR